MEDLIWKAIATHGPWAALAVYLIWSSQKEHSKREGQLMDFLEKQGTELAKATGLIGDMTKMLESVQKAMGLLSNELHEIKGLALSRCHRLDDCIKEEEASYATHRQD